MPGAQLNGSGENGNARAKVPTISVVMPVYNAGPYLSEAIESILDQTWKDFEFIIIDNGSTDNSAETIRSFNDPRIRLVTNPVNVGPPPALNQGLALASGEYIARMDADDIAMPQRLEKQLDFMSVNPSCAVVGTQATFVDGEGKIMYTPWCPTIPDAVRWRLLFTSPMAHSSVMMRRDTLEKLGGYNDSLRHAADYDLWFRVLIGGYEITNLNEVLTLVRIHHASDGMIAREDPQLLEEQASVSQTHIRELLQVDIDPEQLLSVMKLLRRVGSVGEYDRPLCVLRKLSKASSPKVRQFYALTILGIALSSRLPKVTRFRLAALAIARLASPRYGLGGYRFIWRDWITSGRALGRFRFEVRRRSRRRTTQMSQAVYEPLNRRTIR